VTNHHKHVPEIHTTLILDHVVVSDSKYDVKSPVTLTFNTSGVTFG